MNRGILKPFYKLQIVTPDGIQSVECTSTNKADLREVYKKYAHEAGSVVLFKEIDDEKVPEELELEGYAPATTSPETKQV
jgi:hypothetical protein